MAKELTVVLSVLVVLAVVVVGLLAYRLGQLRKAGTPVLFRTLPAEVDRGWRHGTIHYGDDALRYYRLSSLRPGPTRSFCRQRVEIVGRRVAEGTEADIMDGMVILRLNEFAELPSGMVVSRPEQRLAAGGPAMVTYELAMPAGGVTAFQSWLESRQSDRSQRRRSA